MVIAIGHCERLSIPYGRSAADYNDRNLEFTICQNLSCLMATKDHLRSHKSWNYDGRFTVFDGHHRWLSLMAALVFMMAETLDPSWPECVACPHSPDGRESAPENKMAHQFNMHFLPGDWKGPSQKILRYVFCCHLIILIKFRFRVEFFDVYVSGQLVYTVCGLIWAIRLSAATFIAPQQRKAGYYDSIQGSCSSILRTFTTIRSSY
jgi:hypothetical protein